MCSEGTDFGTKRKRTALVERSTTIVKLARGDEIFSLFLNKMKNSFLEVTIMQEIAFYCKRCKKSLHITYIVTGDGNAKVLPNIAIKCVHCKRVLFLKNFTEQKLIEGSKDGKFYI